MIFVKSTTRMSLLVMLIVGLVIGPTYSGLAQVPGPVVNSVSPNSGLNTETTNITIAGASFFGTPTVALGSNVLSEVSLLDSTRLLAVVPPGLPPGTYDLIVTNPDGQVAILQAAFTVRTPNPIVLQLRPNRGRTDIPNDIYIYGFNFAAGVSVKLDATPIPTTRINSTQIRATVPAGLAPGVYDVAVENQGGSSALLADAYTVFELINDDLFSNDYELWTNPIVPRSGQTADIGLVVHRQGGKQVLADVKVSFYNGNPSANGVHIGDGAIPLLSPRSSASTSALGWNPATAGTYTLYAVIDPDNAVKEALETNNVISRTLTVLPPAADQLAPHVDSFSINGGSNSTAEQTVRLDVTASDPEPGTNVKSVLFLEYEYSQGAGQWVPVGGSGWMSYVAAVARAEYAWTLLPSPGVKYLQAWARDDAGNVSLFPFKDFISYLPPSDSVAQNQGRIYRYTLNAGEQMNARVEALSGDPDIYVWAPDHDTRPPWVSNLSNSADEVSFVAPVAGTYQVEVYGYTSAQYQLTVEITQALAKDRSLTVGGIDPDKPAPRTQPIVSVVSVPGNQFAPPASTSGPTLDQRVYLPNVAR